MQGIYFSLNSSVPMVRVRSRFTKHLKTEISLRNLYMIHLLRKVVEVKLKKMLDMQKRLYLTKNSGHKF